LPNLSALGGGSSAGIQALLDGKADIALSSRALRPEELAQNPDLRVAVVGYDALVMVVHRSNPVSRIRTETLIKIYKGEIQNWRELGGPDMPIQPLHRGSTSGTRDFFEQELLGFKPEIAQRAWEVELNAELIDRLLDEPASIAYIGISYVDPQLVKPLAVWSDSLRRFVPPIHQHLLDGTYPWQRPLHMIYRQSDQDRVAPVLDYLASPAGQILVERLGMIPKQERDNPS
jgi:phosphate transport system substrate-binding protein